MFKALGIDLVSLVFQIVAFVILIWLLNRLLFRPIRRTLDARAQRIQESMEEAERIKHQALRADAEYQARIEEAQRRAQEIADQARERARQEREEMLEKARAEAQQFLEDARVQIEMERRDLARDARRQVAGLAVLAAGRLIGESLDDEKHRRLVEQHIAALDAPLEELERALSTLPTGNVGVVQVRSAAPLTEELQAAIREKVTRALGPVDLAFGSDPGLIAGFLLQAGDQVVDLSVARKLRDLFHEVVG